MLCTLSNLLYGIGLTPGRPEKWRLVPITPIFVNQEINLSVKPGAKALGRKRQLLAKVFT